MAGESFNMTLVPFWEHDRPNKKFPDYLLWARRGHLPAPVSFPKKRPQFTIGCFPCPSKFWRSAAKIYLLHDNKNFSGLRHLRIFRYAGGGLRHTGRAAEAALRAIQRSR